MIDRVVDQLGRKLFEVPVGFKWFVPGLINGSLCFGGEESAVQASCAATARYGPPTKMADHGPSCRRDHRSNRKDPGLHYRELTAKFQSPLILGSMPQPRLSKNGNCRSFS